MTQTTLYHQGGGCYTTAQKPDGQTAFVYVQRRLADGKYPSSLPLTEVFAGENAEEAFCFVSSSPGSFEDFAVEVRRLCSGGPKRYHFLWINHPDAPKSSDIKFAANSQRYITTPASFSCRNASLEMQNGTGTEPYLSIAVNSGGNGLQIHTNTDSSASIALRQGGSSASLDVPVTGINLQLDDAVQGIMQFDVALSEPDLDALDVGLRYFWQDGASQDSYVSVRYPLFALPTGITVPLQGNFDPLRLDDAARAYYRFSLAASGQPPQVGSYLRTLLGREVSLTPCISTSTISANTPRLMFAAKPGQPPVGEESVYLVPAGDFSLGIVGGADGGGVAWQRQLLCGLSGTECLTITPRTDSDVSVGDILHFLPNSPACSTATMVKQDGKDVRSFQGLTDAYTTSWAMLLPGTKAPPRWYYSEPAASPLFQHTALDASDYVIDYLPLSQSQLPGSLGDGFPLVPYAACKGDAGDAIGGGDIAAFEQQILNPHRKASIYQMANAKGASLPVVSPAGPAGGIGLVPQGLLNRFDNGNWNLIRFAEVKEQQEYLQFAPASGQSALPQALQNAFLTNQQFLVVSVDNGNLGTMTPQLAMSGWTFNLSPPATQAVGDYRNVLIFKSAKGSIKQLAASPEKWTAYESFNDAKLDPEGRYLSRWMLDYFQAAEQAYDGGKGATDFENFCTLINDPEWSGFIVLKVDIGLGDLSSELVALSAGIDMSRFYAHHVGNEITRVKPDGSGGEPGYGYALNSAVFALVYYTDPAYAQAVAAGGRMPMIQSSSATYDFKVLSLIAVFENAALAGFSSKVMLLINQLFGACVLPSSPQPDIPATNRLILDGAVQRRDGVAVYAFTTPKGEANHFFLDGDTLNSITIGRAEFGVRSQSGSLDKDGSEHFDTRFTLWGDFSFQAGPPLAPDTSSAASTFDLFSYCQLGFSNLAIDMNFTLNQTGNQRSVADRSFGFDALSMTLDQQPLQIDDQATSTGINYARRGSLLSQFPLKLKGFVQSTLDAVKTPEALGYGAVTAPPLKRAGLAGILGQVWYGLSYQLDIGSMGALANNTVFTADMLFAWDPSSGVWYVGMKLPGLGPLDKLLDIEGVIKFGAQEVLFDRLDVPASCDDKDKTVALYTIKFASIGLTLLGLSFPAKGSTNALVFGDPCRTGDTPPKTLGWFGSYVQPGQAKPPALSGPQKG